MPEIKQRIQLICIIDLNASALSLFSKIGKNLKNVSESLTPKNRLKITKKFCNKTINPNSSISIDFTKMTVRDKPKINKIIEPKREIDMP